MKVPVHMLSPGDVLKGSGETVVSLSAGARTPRGKMELNLKKGDRVRYAEWGKYTLINIEDRAK